MFSNPSNRKRRNDEPDDDDPEFVVNHPVYDPQRYLTPAWSKRKKMHLGADVINSICQHNEIINDSSGKWRCCNCQQVIISLAGYSITSS